MVAQILNQSLQFPIQVIVMTKEEITRVMARISEGEFDTKLKSLQGFIVSAISGSYPKPRYIKIYTEIDIPKSRFEYSFDNQLYCYSLFGTCLRIIQDKFASERLKIWHDYHSAEQEQDVPK